MALPAHSGPWTLIQFHNHFFTDGRTPWMSDQLVARPLPIHRTTQTQNKRIHTPNIHALSGIRTHDPSVRASEDSSCLTPRSYCDRQTLFHVWNIDKNMPCNQQVLIIICFCSVVLKILPKICNSMLRLWTFPHTGWNNFCHPKSVVTISGKDAILWEFIRQL
jgi:hypothetical protein